MANKYSRFSKSSSVYQEYRKERMCTSKKAYTLSDETSHLNRLGHRLYKCPYCDYYHHSGNIYKLSGKLKRSKGKVEKRKTEKREYQIDNNEYVCTVCNKVKHKKDTHKRWDSFNEKLIVCEGSQAQLYKSVVDIITPIPKADTITSSKQVKVVYPLHSQCCVCNKIVTTQKNSSMVSIHKKKGGVTCEGSGQVFDKSDCTSNKDIQILLFINWCDKTKTQSHIVKPSFDWCKMCGDVVVRDKDGDLYPHKSHEEYDYYCGGDSSLGFDYCNGKPYSTECDAELSTSGNSLYWVYYCINCTAWHSSKYKPKTQSSPKDEIMEILRASESRQKSLIARRSQKKISYNVYLDGMIYQVIYHRKMKEIQVIKVTPLEG